jgi:hypothetical protein
MSWVYLTQRKGGIEKDANGAPSIILFKIVIPSIVEGSLCLLISEGFFASLRMTAKVSPFEGG